MGDELLYEVSCTVAFSLPARSTKFWKNSSLTIDRTYKDSRGRFFFHVKSTDLRLPIRRVTVRYSEIFRCELWHAVDSQSVEGVGSGTDMIHSSLGIGAISFTQFKQVETLFE